MHDPEGKSPYQYETRIMCFCTRQKEAQRASFLCLAGDIAQDESDDKHSWHLSKGSRDGEDTIIDQNKSDCKSCEKR